MHPLPLAAARGAHHPPVGEEAVPGTKSCFQIPDALRQARSRELDGLSRNQESERASCALMRASWPNPPLTILQTWRNPSDVRQALAHATTTGAPTCAAERGSTHACRRGVSCVHIAGRPGSGNAGELERAAWTHRVPRLGEAHSTLLLRGLDWSPWHACERGAGDGEGWATNPGMSTRGARRSGGSPTPPPLVFCPALRR